MGVVSAPSREAAGLTPAGPLTGTFFAKTISLIRWKQNTRNTAWASAPKIRKLDPLPAPAPGKEICGSIPRPADGAGRHSGKIGTQWGNQFFVFWPGSGRTKPRPGLFKTIKGEFMAYLSRNERRRADKRSEFLKYFAKYPNFKVREYAQTFSCSTAQISKWRKEALAA